MKALHKIFVLLILLLLNCACAVQQQQPTAYTQQAQQRPVDFQAFYDDLSPYGQWVENPVNGYVWIPAVNQDFAPYSTDGYWVNTDYGWTWASNYNWGWAPFHYGRWDYDNFYGWYWVPGNEWGPAWVTWRGGNGYYGWAPMRPGMNINMSYNENSRDINRWNFIRDRDFGQSDMNRHYVDRREYNTIINNSTVINNTTVDRRRNTTYVAGPTRDNVQSATGRRINSVAIQDNDRPGQTLNNKELRIYRPQVERTADRAQKPAPSRVTNMQEVKPPSQRNAANPRNIVTPNRNSSDQQTAQPVRQLDRRNQERQQQIERKLQQQQSTQPVQPAQPKNDRRRQENQAPPIQTPEQPRQPAPQQQVTPQQQQQQNEQRRREQSQGQPAPQHRDNVQPAAPPVQQPQVNPLPQKQEPQTPPVQQQPQVAPPQQQRRQERQQIKQQQRSMAPAANPRRLRQEKAREDAKRE